MVTGPSILNLPMADHSLSTFDIYSDAHMTTRGQKIQARVGSRENDHHCISDV